MSKPVINTHAGDDSDGRLWGIEGINILFILAGLLLSVGLSLMLFRSQAHSAAFSFGLGSLPLVLACAYVFAFRQGRPRSCGASAAAREACSLLNLCDSAKCLS